jgi:hypothetical protein
MVASLPARAALSQSNRSASRTSTPTGCGPVGELAWSSRFAVPSFLPPT